MPAERGAGKSSEAARDLAEDAAALQINDSLPTATMRLPTSAAKLATKGPASQRGSPASARSGSPSARRTPSKKASKKAAKNKTSPGSPRGVEDLLSNEGMSPVKEEMSEEATTLLNEATGRSPKTSPRASPKASPEAALPTVPPVAPSAGPISLEVNVEAQGVVCAVNAVKAAPAEEVAAPVAATVEPTEAQRAVASAMALNRAMLPANARVKSFNFDINGLVGFDMQNATIGVVGDSAAAAASIKYFGAFAKASGTGCVLRACPAALASYPPVPVPSRRREHKKRLA